MCSDFITRWTNKTEDTDARDGRTQKKKKKKKKKARRLITILKRTNKYGIQVPTNCYLCFQLSFHTNYRILQHKQEEQNSKHLKSKEATLI